MDNQSLPANLSTLIMSLASSATVSMGISPHPETEKTEVNKKMAEFNIDLLLTIKEKTTNNLTQEESKLLDTVISQLQTQFIQI
ncbi:MAG: DUF1844 domain-containing protein [Bdellovibrionaceae bacterium]|nr:DUF1844 domain-containing protein [Pseudobdellovibrionaceae bacterium]